MKKHSNVADFKALYSRLWANQHGKGNGYVFHAAHIPHTIENFESGCEKSAAGESGNPFIMDWYTEPTSPVSRKDLLTTALKVRNHAESEKNMNRIRDVAAASVSWMSPSEDTGNIRRLRSNWDCFMSRGIVNPDVNPFVAKSWEKCRAYGIDPQGGLSRVVDEKLFSSILRENETLVEVAGPVMRSIMELVHQSHFWLVLTDCGGYVLEAMGDDTVYDLARKSHFGRGSLWSDLETGTNAISVALDYNTPVQLCGPEHYCAAHHIWTCSAAPIHGLMGEVVGCVNMSGSYTEMHPHTLGLVMTAALSIETQILSLHHAKLMQISLDGNSDGMMVLDQEFRPVWVNRAARDMLEMSGDDQTGGGDFRHFLPDVDWDGVRESVGDGRYQTDDTRLAVGCATRPCSASILSVQAGFNRSYAVTLKRQEQVIRSVNVLAGNRASYTFDDIYTRNATMSKTISLAKKYARYKGAVLIQGESGTGKELFAQAIHSASDRADKPFVAINCASLPRDLIESELFGYEKGAFTGARSEGNPGKFELADHGTVFLDEIGELPLEFQAKLLRVVETHAVRRLGGNSEKNLDVRIIAATNRNLRVEAMEGRFRDDLFFRLNVLLLPIPPLRDRKEDIVHCAGKFLRHFNDRYPDQQKEMSDAFKNGIMKYHWPGNVRELQNSMERAFYSCPDDILDVRELDAIIDRKDETPNALLTKRETQQKQIIIEVLGECDGDVKTAALQLGKSLATVYKRIKKFGIVPKDYRL